MHVMELLFPPPHHVPKGISSVWPNECPEPLKLGCLRPCGCMQALAVAAAYHLITMNSLLAQSHLRNVLYQHQCAAHTRITPILLQWK